MKKIITYSLLILSIFMLVSCGRKYTVEFYEEDATTLIYSTKVLKGTSPSYDSKKYGVPEKEEDEDFLYTFSGWKSGDKVYKANEELPKVTANTKFIAEFAKTNKYLVTFKDVNGAVLYETKLLDGSAITYPNESPTKNNYLFVGWSDGTTVYTNNTLPLATKAYEFVATYIGTQSPNVELSNLKEGVGDVLYSFNLLVTPASNQLPLEIYIGKEKATLYVDNVVQTENYLPLNGEYIVQLKEGNKAYLVAPKPLYQLKVGQVVTDFSFNQAKNVYELKNVSLSKGSTIEIFNYSTYLVEEPVVSNEFSNGIMSSLNINVTGKYNITYNAEENLLYSEYLVNDQSPSVYITGTMNEWASSNDNYKLSVKNNLYTISLLLDKGTNFKLWADNSFYGTTNFIGSLNDLLLSTGSNDNFVVGYLALYTITFNLASSKIEIQVEDSYKVMINEEEFDLALDMEGALKTQYSIKSNFKKGDVISFSDINVSLDGVKTNNLALKDEKMKVRVTGDELKLYLKLELDDTGKVLYTAYLEGYKELYFMGDTLMTDASDEQNLGGWTKQYVVKKDVLMGEELSFILDDEPLVISNIDGNVQLKNGKYLIHNNKTNASIFIQKYVNEDETVTYKLYVEGYEDLYFVNNELMADASSETNADGWTKQYLLVKDLTKDAELKIKFEETELALTKTEVKGNAQLIDGKILVHNDKAQAKIYLKLYKTNNVTTYKLYVEGYEILDTDYVTSYVYLDDSWKSDNALVKVYVFDSELPEEFPSSFLDLELVDDNDSGKIYKFTCHNSYKKFDVLRIKPTYTGEYNWSKKDEWLWNQTADTTIDETHNFYILSATSNIKVTKAEYKPYALTLYKQNGEDNIRIEKYPYESLATSRPENPIKEHYTFTGWYYFGESLSGYTLFPFDKMPIGDVNVIAFWSPNKYTITFKNEDGTVLYEKQFTYLTELNENHYQGETPTKAPTNTVEFTFSGWTPELAVVEGDATYTALYSSATRLYTIRWLNDDSSVIKTDKLEYQQTPAYTGDTPTKAKDAKYYYVFKAWDKEIVAVTEDTDYTATYDHFDNPHKVTFVDQDGETVLLAEAEYLNGEVVLVPEDPVPPVGDKYVTYEFAGWKANGQGEPISKDNIPTPVADTIYYAYYNPIKHYTLTIGDKVYESVEKINTEYKFIADVNANDELVFKRGYDVINPKVASPSSDKGKGNNVVNTTTSNVNHYIVQLTEPGAHIYLDEETTMAWSLWVSTGYMVVGSFGDNNWGGSNATKVGVPMKHVDGDNYEVELMLEKNDELKVYTSLFPTDGEKWIGGTDTNNLKALTTGIYVVTLHKETGHNPYVSIALKKYDVVFKDFDGTVLKSEKVSYGSMPVLPSNPDNKDGYIFDKWDKEIAVATEDVVYTAEYAEAVLLSIKVSESDGGYGILNKTLEEVKIKKGTALALVENIITVNDAQYIATPIDNTKQYTYTFKNFDLNGFYEVSAKTGERTEEILVQAAKVLIEDIGDYDLLKKKKV